MSYNYDINPWDDNYTNASGQQQQQQRTGSGYYATDGYANPMAQYSDSPNQQYQYEDEQQPEQQQEQEQQQQQQQAPSQSALGRFLRQRIPFYGTLMDTMPRINLPFLDALVQKVNRDLLVSKMFYFFFYSAFGSLFPLMGVYFKQLGMNPAQVGILTGVRPFIEIFSAPFWNSLAERFHKSKALLLFSVLSWIVFTHSLAHIRPPASACVAFNDTDYVLYTPYSSNDLSNYDVGQLEDYQTTTESKSETKRESNEIFINKMPEAVGGTVPKEKEVKGEILASEENQNAQRRRRRRRSINGRRKKRAISDTDDDDDEALSNKRYIYSIGTSNGNGKGENDEGYETQHLDLDIDLENDFEDKVIIDRDNQYHNTKQLHNNRPQQQQTVPQGWSPFFDSDGELADPASSSSSFGIEDEFEKLYSKGARYRRDADFKDVDDLLGKSDETESEGTGEESEGRERDEMSPSRNEENSESRDREKEERDEEQEENESGGEGEGGGGDNNRRIVKQQQQEPTTTTTTTTEDSIEENTPTIPTTSGTAVNKTKRVYKQRHKTPPTHIVGMSPITVEYAVNYNKDKHSQFVTPMFSTIVYKLDDIKEVFFLLLLLISLGEFFSAPALTLADSATLSYLGDNTDLYGRQRMFGSLSWAVTLLLVGMALDNATSIADHPCGPHQRERSYTVCFIIFSLLMACAFFTATQFRFNYPKSTNSVGSNVGGGQTMVATTTKNNSVVTTTVDNTGSGNIDELYASTQPRSIFNTAPPVNAPPPNINEQGKEKFEFLDKWKSAVFAQRTWEVPEWVNVFRQFRNSLHLTYLFITWFLGCGVGLVFTFLFWHLQDTGGTPTLFGICSVINHISEILAYFFSFSFIKRFGHTRVSNYGSASRLITCELSWGFWELRWEWFEFMVHKIIII